MDETEIDLATMIDTVQIQYTSNYVLMVALSGLLWYYITTFGEEVDRIWPQPARKPGRMLFLILRYITILGVVLEFVVGYPAYIPLSLEACEHLVKGWWVIVSLGNVFAEAIFWICLSALLGSKKWPIYLLAFGFMGFEIPIVVISYYFISTWRTISVEPWERQVLRTGCSGYASSDHANKLYPIAAYIGFARAAVISIVAFSTFARRYRRNNSSLLTIVKREGAMYYFSVGILQLFIGLRYSASSGIKDKYGVVTAIRRFLIPIFADRLLLGLKARRYTETDIVATAMFDDSAHRRLSRMPRFGVQGEETVISSLSHIQMQPIGKSANILG
ncbi:hypothetical protein DFP72DRAFT_1093673 [Ephemerocybe angulata]|uniref:DUF6533 domain-containing protein n=1 Tax=Ephemerocybe angulata TaxID=980116 RepID=A0A8H6HCW4_9AGAR|nr:hypothetical protein DFP72DRAFT_1093673 [Tulosesus angulatus]